MIRDALIFLTAYVASRRRILLALGSLIAMGILVFSAFSLHNLTTVLRNNVRDSQETIDLLKQNVMLLAQDSGELRSALGLPPRNYPPLESEKPETASKEGESKGGGNVLFYRAVENLLSRAEMTRLEKGFMEIMDSAPVSALQKKNGFLLKKTSSGAVFEKNGTAYFTFTLGGKAKAYNVKSFAGKALSFVSDPELVAFLTEESARLELHFANLSDRIRRLQEILRGAPVQEQLLASDLVLETPEDGADTLLYKVTMKVERDVAKLKIGLDKRRGSFFIDGASFDDSDVFALGVTEALGRLDLRTTEELRVEKVKGVIVELSEDTGFRSYLQSKKLTLSLAPREDNEYVYYDFISAEGVRAGALGIQKVHGEIYLFDADDISLGSLKTFGLKTAEDAKKKIEIPKNGPALSTLNDRFSHTFLVVGAHEKMTDTIILATVNEKRNDIALISLPRDLFFRNRKINTLYVRYGPERFVQEISAMTGLAIERYVIIDMFAFIDAINILGGIDITLNEDLVDPTYRVRDGGRWSTLFYPAGSHHVNGIEALRIARSRHFTSDFGRAQRQQDLISSIKDKLVGLGLGEIGKMYNLVQVLVKYVDTNLTPFEIVNYFLKYGEARVATQNVVDTNNSLYHSYTNLKFHNLKEEEVDETFDKGAYILLPLEDDWEAFRRFIRTLLDGAST